jgi:hypothetical protein
LRTTQRTIVVVVSLFTLGLLASCADSVKKSAGSAAAPRFADIPPGATLPTGERCAQLVSDAGASTERVSENDQANHRRVTAGDEFNLPRWDKASFGMDPAADELRARIDGAFEGTTEQIIRWGACKWGFDEDVVRAVAQTESSWRQSFEGDRAPDGGYLSFGLLQVKRTTHPGTFPATQVSTGFNVDYALAYRRACYEGYLSWLTRAAPEYRAGDEWGCVAHWFSGGWHDGPG